MRSVVLDTETTGLNAGLGDRIIELGCIEVLSRRVTGNHFHRYINPERESEEGALKVHGIDHEFLQDKPKFREISAEFLDYIQGAELVIHNAAFDVEFLNLELGRLGLPPIEAHCAGIVDSLKIARELHPGKKNSLDALCERYQVAHAHRTLHGALLDAALLAEVYLAMTRGQESLAIELGQPRPALGRAAATEGERPPLIVLRPSAEELAEHASLLADMEAENKTQCVWRRFETAVEMLDRV
ncbi:MAG: DNA polymerase III subunit epsilon [Betaproteobacteria bacterium]|nr:MAG: DNA polymerase III subunit epsilon [Betaproteobacteria bacterium]TMH92814.1 MAG: DNA polymerase III subunit epsilon [Betaproteobacteria bacterium]